MAFSPYNEGERHAHPLKIIFEEYISSEEYDLVQKTSVLYLLLNCTFQLQTIDFQIMSISHFNE